MTLVLENGYHYEDIIGKNRSFSKTKICRSPNLFDEYTVNIDVSELGAIDAADYKRIERC